MAALGESYEQCNPIALGCAGIWIENIADSADDILRKSTVGALKSLAAIHGIFINRFVKWLEYRKATG